MVNKKDVFLDVRHLGKKFIEEFIPQEAKLALLYEGMDISKELLPITPSAHYSMGGIEVDSNLETTISNLFAVGECSDSKIHGANRLGGNSLLEIIVFGKIAVNNALSKVGNKSLSYLQEKKDKQYINSLFNDKRKINLYHNFSKLGDILFKKVGIVRDGHTLQEALNDINLLDASLSDFSPKNNQNLIELLEFYNSLEIAKYVTIAAINRKKSVGAHFRIDDEN